MYGTRKQLTRELKRAFAADEPLALLIWTEESVTAQGLDMTQEEALQILSRLGEAPMHEHQEHGISFRTVHHHLKALRAHPQARQVVVSAELLARLNQMAETALNIVEATEQDGGLPASSLVTDGQETVKQIRCLLAA